MMKPTSAQYERMMKRDARYDGKFYIGVVTTGIYCLPSCSARKPKKENVRIFTTEEEALAAGLRACLRCKPDLFGRGENAGENAYVRIVEAIASGDSAATDARALAKSCGISKTKASELARTYSHTSLAALVRQQRIKKAARPLIDTNDRIIDVCFASGFESEATFHRQFTSCMGLSPGAYRALRESTVFALKLPADYRTAEVFAFHGRSDTSLCERITGSTLTKALTVGDRNVVVDVTVDRTEALCRLLTSALPTADLMLGIHAALLRLLGFDSETAAFERLMRARGLSQVIGRRAGLRIPLTATPFEALTWAIIGQQINLQFASTLRQALIGAHGKRIDGLVAHPSPAIVASLDPADLVKLRFSRQKAQYLIGAAQAIEAGRLPLDAMRALPASRAEASLTAITGIGTWTARYTMLRGIGFGDCVPVGDAGLRNALQRYHQLSTRPDDAQMERLMDAFRPHRSLATAHLWASLSDS